MTGKYVTPGNWLDRIGAIPSLEGVDVDAQKLLAVLFGSTHSQAQWRYDENFIKALGHYAQYCFNPQVDGWDPSYAEIEALAKHLAAVVVVRLENHDVEMGSMGSMAEIGSAILTGMLRGYKVIISFEDGLIDSLDENASATSLYHNLVKQLHDLKHTFAGDYFEFHYGDNLYELGEMIFDAMEAQESNSVWPINEATLSGSLQSAHQKMRNPSSILFTGSGGPYTQMYEFDSFWDFLKDSASRIWRNARTHETYRGWMADMWNSLYHGSISQDERVVLLKLANDNEQAHKRIATFVVTSIMGQAASLGAASEIFLNIIWALVNSQGIAVYLEEYDAADHFKQKWFDEFIDILPEDLDWNGIRKANIYSQTDIFTSVDATRRVRAIVKAHLQVLLQDPVMADLVLVGVINESPEDVQEDRRTFVNEVCGIPNLI